MASGTQNSSTRAATKIQVVLSLPALRAGAVTWRGTVSVVCGVFTTPPRALPCQTGTCRAHECVCTHEHRCAALVSAGHVFAQQTLRAHHQDNRHEDKD